MRHAMEQVETHHVAMVGNGNFGRWDRYSRIEQSQFIDANKASGYRFVLQSVEVPASMRPGARFDIQSAWSNLGVTPAYNTWDVTFDLRQPSTGESVWEGTSRIDLQSLLPTGERGGDNPAIVGDTFTLPTSVPTGEYELGIVVRDPQDYYAPLALAIEGRDPDGRYPLGSVLVDAPEAR
jgi:hypothetical protein